MVASPHPTQENSIGPVVASRKRHHGGVMSFLAPGVAAQQEPAGDGSPKGAGR
jgi:hypothetical protein